MKKVKSNHCTLLALSIATILLWTLSAVSQSEPSPRADTPEAALSQIRTHVEALLSKPQPEGKSEFGAHRQEFVQLRLRRSVPDC